MEHPTDLVERLIAHRTIGSAPRAELEWLARNGTLRRYEPGDPVSTKDRDVEALYIILSGQIAIHVVRGAVRRRMVEWKGGDVAGVLPYSRLRRPPGDAVVEAPSEVLALPRERLPELIHECHAITTSLVHVMTDRARQFTAGDLHEEKMASLGTLAAGLAHELNNPASAAARSAHALLEELSTVETSCQALGATGLSPDEFAAIDGTLGRCMMAAADSTRTPLEQSDCEDAVLDWLAAHGVTGRVAESLAKTGVDVAALDHLAQAIPAAALAPALTWIGSGSSGRRLALSIEAATSRIHDLVAAVKRFTYMDRGSMPEFVDVGQGLIDTRAVLEGRARGKGVAIGVEIAADLPRIYAFGGEINQIWEQLLDNAIDAVGPLGHVELTAAREGPMIVVCVVDDGPGIPDEIRARIFDPFFTTKGVGEGVGLGLDIARRIVRWHGGSIDVTSQPGRTVFRVALPIEKPAGSGTTVSAPQPHAEARS